MPAPKSSQPAGVAALVLALSSGCASHEDGPDAAAPNHEPARAPTLVAEAEPAIKLPPIVAPPLPELAPTRPLTNLAPLWQDILTLDQPASTLFEVGRIPVAMQPADAMALGLVDAGVDAEAIPTTQRGLTRVAGPLFLFDTGDEYVAFDIQTNLIRWSAQLSNARSYMSVVSPRVLVANYYQSDTDRLIAWSLHDGRPVWERRGELDDDFSRIKWLASDPQRGYFTSEIGLVAFDLHTGQTLWSATLAEPECGVAIASTGDQAGAVVVVEDPAGHRVLDDRGAEIGRFDSLGATNCGWESYASSGVALAVIDGQRLYVFDSQPPAQGSSPLRAFALDTRRELWKATGFDDDLLVVDHDAVFVSRNEQVLLALDADSGQPRAEISIGAGFELQVQPVGGAAGPYVVVTDYERGQWVLGRGEVVVAPESYELRGQLVTEPGGLNKRRLAGVRVRVGEQIVKTDKRGRFIAKGSTRGALTVEQADPYGEYKPGEWTQVAIESRRVVLDGRGAYVVDDIQAYEVSME